VVARVERNSWVPQPIFELIGELGAVDRAELERTFNQGIGMIAVVGAAAADTVLARLAERGVKAWVCGEVTKASGPAAVELVGDHSR